ncbi:MAG: ATP-binding protein [Candidatus Sericytochromatia bacterium]|nr:ATP-binding protein [Candidatus Sericytochromatia bacterium]
MRSARPDPGSEATFDRAPLPELRLLGELSRGVAEGYSPDRLIRTGIRQMTELLDARYCAVVLRQGTGSMGLEALWVRGIPEDRQSAKLAEARTMLAEHLGRYGQPERLEIPDGPILVEDVQQDPESTPMGRRMGLAWGFGSYFGSPLVHDGRTLGHVFTFFVEPRRFSARELQVAAALADQLVTALVIARNQAFSEQVIRQMPAMLATLDAHRCLTWVSPQAAEWLQRKAEDLIGKPLGNLLEGLTPVDLAHQPLPRGPFRLEAFPLRLPGWNGGQTSWWDLAVQPLDSARDGSATLLLAIDVTPRIEREQREAEHTARQKHLDRLRDDFVSAASHELHTPLASIIGHAELLEDGLEGPLSPRQLDFLHEIQLAAGRLQRLVDDLLDYAKLEAGTFSLSQREVNLADLARQVASSMWPQLRDASVQLLLPEETPETEVSCDPQRIGQVLLNLIGNAIKFTPKGGTIRVDIDRTDHHVVVRVSDDGIGIQPEDVAKVFDKYFQGSRNPVSAKRGSGLGLYVSRAFIEAHGGEIGVEPGATCGSTFWFKLPYLVP